MVGRGIAFVPASGAPVNTLRRLFDGRGAERSLSFIAENGTLVTHGDEVVSTTTVSDEFARTVVDAVRAAREMAPISAWWSVAQTVR